MSRYSLVAIILHWAIAALLAFQISVGWALEDLGAGGFILYQWHKSVGIAILGLTLLRVAVRYWKPRPPKVEGSWQGALASGVHGGLYVFMLGAPLTGWALVSTAKVKVPTLLFGVLPLPHLPLPSGTHALAENSHGLIAWFGIMLFLLHIAGALRHHMLMRDGLIWRMVPGRSTALLIALPALMLLGGLVGRAILPSPAPKTTAPVEAADAAQNMAEIVNIAEIAPGNTATNVIEATIEEPVGSLPAWTVQPGGKIGFTVGNDGQTISGGFAKWTAAIVMDPDHPDSADIRVTIDMTSASVGDAYQDGMLPGRRVFRRGCASHRNLRCEGRGGDCSGPLSR